MELEQLSSLLSKADLSGIEGIESEFFKLAESGEIDLFVPVPDGLNVYSKMHSKRKSHIYRCYERSIFDYENRLLESLPNVDIKFVKLDEKHCKSLIEKKSALVKEFSAGMTDLRDIGSGKEAVSLPYSPGLYYEVFLITAVQHLLLDQFGSDWIKEKNERKKYPDERVLDSTFREFICASLSNTCGVESIPGVGIQFSVDLLDGFERYSGVDGNIQVSISLSDGFRLDPVDKVLPEDVYNFIERDSIYGDPDSYLTRRLKDYFYPSISAIVDLALNYQYSPFTFEYDGRAKSGEIEEYKKWLRDLRSYKSKFGSDKEGDGGESEFLGEETYKLFKHAFGVTTRLMPGEKEFTDCGIQMGFYLSEPSFPYGSRAQDLRVAPSDVLVFPGQFHRVKKLGVPEGMEGVKKYLKKNKIKYVPPFNSSISKEEDNKIYVHSLNMAVKWCKELLSEKDITDLSLHGVLALVTITIYCWSIKREVSLGKGKGKGKVKLSKNEILYNGITFEDVIEFRLGVNRDQARALGSLVRLSGRPNSLRSGKVSFDPKGKVKPWKSTKVNYILQRLGDSPHNNVLDFIASIGPDRDKGGEDISVINKHEFEALEPLLKGFIDSRLPVDIGVEAKKLKEPI